MKKLTAFVSTVNQYLLFIAVLIIIVISSKNIIQELTTSDYVEPRVKLIKNSDNPAKVININYRTNYRRQVKDVLIFAISSNAIENIPEEKTSKTLNMFSEFSPKSQSKFQTVNYLFVPKTGPSYLLMSKDTYIRNTSFYSNPKKRNGYKRLKNIFLLVTNDTNSDGYLSKKDSADLYVSDYNGKNMYLVIKDVEDYDLMNDNLLMIEVGTVDDRKFFTYDLITKNLEKIDTQTPLTRD